MDKIAWAIGAKIMELFQSVGAYSLVDYHEARKVGYAVLVILVLIVLIIIGEAIKKKS